MSEALVPVTRSTIAVAGTAAIALPQAIVEAGPVVVERFLEFFAGQIANDRTRAAYACAAGQFLDWCAARRLGLRAIAPLHVAAYIRTHPGSVPTVKQHLAAIRVLCDWLVVQQVLPVNPAAAVRGPKHVVTKGSTPVLTPGLWCMNAQGRGSAYHVGRGSEAMASTKSSRVNPKYKKKYRVGNWRAYERGLRARGDVTIWFSDEALRTWTPPPTRCRGGQQRYSNLAILTALTLRMLFHLPLRQTEGFVASVLGLMGLELNAPDHTTLSRRNRDVLVPALRRGDDGPIHLIVDSTGLKTFGAGEWCSRKHRKANERRGWRKLHIGVDDDGYVVAEALTSNAVDDADMLPDLLGQVDATLRRFTGDGAYDTRSAYQAVGEAGGAVKIVVPPRRPATASVNATGPWTQRTQHIERIAEIGRQAWQKETGYRQQARVEGTFLRYKRILGDRLRAKGFEAQQREAMVGCTVLNTMLALGKAQSSAVAE